MSQSMESFEFPTIREQIDAIFEDMVCTSMGVGDVSLLSLIEREVGTILVIERLREARDDPAKQPDPEAQLVIHLLCEEEALLDTMLDAHPTDN